MPADAVVHVGTGQDFTNLPAAVDSFGEEEGTVIVHEGYYTDSVTVGGGRVLAFLAFESDSPIWDNQVGLNSQLFVSHDGVVLLDGLELSGSYANPSLMVTGGRAWVDRSHVVNNLGGGIRADTGAELTLRNCFVGGNGLGANALEVDTASANILYSTLAVGRNNAIALLCVNPTSVLVRNSLMAAKDATWLVSSGLDVQCAQADITFTVTESEVPGMGNYVIGTVLANWFASYANGDFHLQSTAPRDLANVAQWQTGDPRTDIDGDPRPNIDGAFDYAGADRP